MHMKTNHFERFSHKIDVQVGQLLRMEPILINYNSTFAFKSSLEIFTGHVKKELFKLVFNEHLFKFLEKKIEAIQQAEFQTPCKQL